VSIWMLIVSYINLPLHPTVSQLNQVYTFPFLLLLLISSHMCIGLPFTFSTWRFVCISNIHHPFCMSSLSHSPWFEHPRNNQWRVQIMNLTIIEFPP
jgi:hypothetical protein